MKFNLKEQPLTRFLVVALCAYLAWLLIYEALMSEMGAKVDFDIAVSKVAANSAKVAMELVGFDPYVTQEGSFVIIALPTEDSYGVHIGPECNGVSLFALFLIYVLAFPGPWKKKLWFIPLGVLAIHLLNTIRISVLCYIETYYPQYLDLNHNYTFQIIVYGFVFFLWYLWTSKLSGLNSLSKKEEV